MHLKALCSIFPILSVYAASECGVGSATSSGTIRPTSSSSSVRTTASSLSTVRTSSTGSVTSRSASSSSLAPTSSATSRSASSGSSVPTSSRTSGSATSSSATSSSSSSASASVLSPNAKVASTILIIARDETTAKSASLGLNGYGIPFQKLVVPQSGTTLPTLNSTSQGNFGGFIVASGVQYDYGASTGFKSALTDAQWSQIYAYQIAYGVRMVQFDIWPDASTGMTALGTCCTGNTEQLISFTNTAAFPQAGLKTGAGLSTQGLFHTPARIADTSTTTEIAQFASNSQFTSVSTAAVINNFSGREQMVFFTSFALEWSATSNVLQHAFIAWMTRGVYAGYRRVNLNTQIDDMFLETEIYPEFTRPFRVSTQDMTDVASWVSTINGKMSPGSSYLPEIGHNGNGNLVSSQSQPGGQDICDPGSIGYDECFCDTPLEFQKPLGTGTNVWPTTPARYGYSARCVQLDPLEKWFANTANRDKFMHLTHTFTHLSLNNATYSDALKEIQFNQAWMSQIGIAAGKFSANGIIPPAITGLHNGDVLRAWKDAGLTNCVGDNTRAPLRNTQNDMWPLMTTVAANGYDGFQVNPRWATRIYFNCDTADCTTQEWINTSAGSGTFTDLLNVEKADTMRHLFGLYRDPYMFHQANLRTTGIPPVTVNGVSSQISIFQAWVEVVVQEFVRVCNWPIITLKHSDMSAAFAARMARDRCGYGLTYTRSNGKITGVTVTANGNTCSSPIPVTVPGTVTNTQGFTTEKIGNDPLTVWVRLTGSPVTLTLSTPV